MRTTLIIILILFAGIYLGSCSRSEKNLADSVSNEYRLVNLHYENSGGEKGITHFYYDQDERNYQAVWQLADSSRSSLNHHSFDSSGRMITKFREYSDGITSLQNFQYDPSGNLIFEDFSRSDSVSGSVDYIYGEDGRVRYADCKGLNGWFFGKIVYTWEKDLKTGAEIFSDSVNFGSIEYQYDEDRLVLEEWNFGGDSGRDWRQVFRYEYQKAAPETYTSSNVFIRESPWYRIASESYDFNGESGGPSYYNYDKKGKLLSKEFLRSDGLRTMTVYDYDSTGLLDHSLREYGDGRTTDFLYWYSVERKLLVKTFQWTDGSSGSETYRYKNGRLLRGEYVNVDGWLNGILDFIYNDTGIIIAADFTGDDGNDARLDFSYDRNFNLKRIQWTFSSGHTQTYSFIYEPNTI